MVIIFKIKSYFNHELYDKLLSKKNDEDGVERAKDWIEAHPADPTIGERFRSLAQYEKYVLILINSLKKIPITPSNEPLITGHLVKIAEKSDMVNQYLWKHLSKIKADKETIRTMKSTLIFTCEKRSL